MLKCSSSISVLIILPNTYMYLYIIYVFFLLILEAALIRQIATIFTLKNYNISSGRLILLLFILELDFFNKNIFLTFFYFQIHIYMYNMEVLFLVGKYKNHCQPEYTQEIRFGTCYDDLDKKNRRRSVVKVFFFCKLSTDQTI